MNKAAVVIVFEAGAVSGARRYTVLTRQICMVSFWTPASEELTHSFCESVVTTFKLQVSLEKKDVLQAQTKSQAHEKQCSV